MSTNSDEPPGWFHADTGEANPDTSDRSCLRPGDHGVEMPLFPLHVVLFPGMPLPLQIFEPRYHRMIQRCIDQDRTFGVTLITEGEEADGAGEVFDVGTSAHIERVEKLPDGRLAITTRGVQRFRILERLPDNPYPRAIVTMLDEEPGVDRLLIEEVQGLLMEFVQGLARRMGQDWDELNLPDDPALLGYVVGALLPCSLLEKQKLLQAPSAGDRLRQAVPMLQGVLDQQLRETVESGGEEEHEAKVARPFEPSLEFSSN